MSDGEQKTEPERTGDDESGNGEAVGRGKPVAEGKPAEPAARSGDGAAERGNLIAEFFLLRRALHDAAAIPDEVRASVAGPLALARQRAAAADHLWTGGHDAEGLVLAAAAVEAAREAAAQFIAGRDPGRLAATLAAADGAARAAREAGPPALDEDLTSAHRGLYHRLESVGASLRHGLGAALRTPRELRHCRAVRWAAVAVVVLAAAAVAGWVLRPRDRERYAASACYQPESQFGAALAFDGNRETEWATPDGRAGWVEVRLSPAVDVHRLLILNGHNGHYNDRAVKEFAVELYAGNRLVRTLEDRFPRLDPRPEWRVLPVNVNGVDRIRLVVRSFFGLGASLAELAWE